MAGCHRDPAILEITALGGGRIVARNAQDAHAVAAVRRGVHLERGVVEIERLSNVAPEFEGLRQFEDPIVLVAQSELPRRTQHPERL